MRFLIIPLTFFIFAQPSLNAQDEYIASSINASNPSNRNINHPDGTTLQDLKRSSGLAGFSSSSSIFSPILELIFGGVRRICGFTLVNNLNQDKKPYIITAEHCINELIVGTTYEALFTFDYEMPNSNRGDENSDAYISGFYTTKFKVIFLDTYSDLALIELIEYNPQLLKYAYAAGWDNTIHPEGYYSNISHPKVDHKKVFINPNENIPEYFLDIRDDGPTRKGIFYYTGNIWNNVNVEPESGSSGSGYFTHENLLNAVDYCGGNNSYSYASAIANKWWAKSGELGLSNFLDSNNTWLNQIPGGYMDDLEPNTEDFTLKLLPNSPSILPKRTPSVSDKNPTVLEDNVLWTNPGLLFQTSFWDEEPAFVSDWHEISGIKSDKILNNTDIVLSVYYLDQDPVSGLYTERLIYGAYADNSTPVNEPTNFGFKGESWDCDNPPANFPPCNRFPDNSSLPLVSPTRGASTEVKQNYIDAYANHARMREDVIPFLSSSKIPIKIRLENLGDTPVDVKAIAYPGGTPMNALQLFEPQKVWDKFKSYKYLESRLNSEIFHIESIEVTQEKPEGENYTRTINTGNNGGYVNLVNPNFKIGPIEPSITDNDTNEVTFTINLDNPNDLSYSYSVWIDYFNKDVAGGKNTELYTYNFVNDPTPHDVELIKQDINRTGNSISFTYLMPTADKISLSPGDNRLTRLRIAVKEGGIPPREFQTVGIGEVEDYLIEIKLPSEQEIIRRKAKISLNAENKERAKLVQAPGGDVQNSGAVYGAVNNLIFEQNLQQNNLGNALALGTALTDSGSSPTTFNPILIPLKDLLSMAYQSLGNLSGGNPDDPGETCPNNPNPNNDPYPGFDSNNAEAWQYWEQFNSLYNNLARIIRWWDNLHPYPNQQVPFITDPNGNIQWALFNQFVSYYNHVVSFKNLINGTWNVYDVLYTVYNQNDLLEAAFGTENIALYRSLYNYILKFQCFKNQLISFKKGVDDTLNLSQNLAKIAVDWWGEVIPNNLQGRSVVNEITLINYPQANTIGVIYHAKGDTNHTLVGVNNTGQLVYELKVGSETKTITSTNTLPLHKKVLITHRFDKGEMQLFLNKTQVGSEHILPTSFGYTNYTHLNNGTRVAAPLKNFTNPVLNDGLQALDAQFHQTLFFDQVLPLEDIENLVPNEEHQQRGKLDTTIIPEVKNSKVEKKEATFSLFPNPAKEELNILIEVQKEGPLRLGIFDLNGKQVYEMERAQIGQGYQLITLKKLNLNAGNYVLKIKTGNVVKTEQVVFE